MNERDGWWFPDRSTGIYQAVNTEWNEKSEYALSLCKGRDLVVQAGANIGVFPARLARVFKKVVTFEPYPLNIECFKVNTAIRGIENVDLYEAALSNDDAGVAFTFAPSNNCGAVQVGREGSVNAMTLDSLELPACDLIWLDIEGYEVKALAGAAQTIAKYKPVIILENKGLISGYESDFDGSQELRDMMKAVYGYSFDSRIMRDDFFVP